VGIMARVAQLDGLPEHGDVRDWMKTHTQEDLDRVVKEAVAPDTAADDQEATPSGWEVFSLVDAYQEREPPVEVVEGLFQLPSLSIVYGAPGTLKSFVLLDMLMCIAAGKAWLPPLDTSQVLPRNITQASVLWVDFDNGPRRMHQRAGAVARAYNLAADVPFHYVSMPLPWLDASELSGLAPLRAAIERYDAKVVVIDNLLLIKGGVEENSADMGLVMARLRALTEEYGSAVIPMHHQRKDHGNGGRSGDRLRGHSSIEAAVDLALLVEREEGSSQITLRSTKTRDVDVIPFAAMFTYTHAIGTNELYEARFYGVCLADETSDRAIERTIREVLMEQTELLKDELNARVRGRLPTVGINRVRGVINRMVSQHHLNARPGLKKGVFVSLRWRHAEGG